MPLCGALLSLSALGSRSEDAGIFDHMPEPLPPSPGIPRLSGENLNHSGRDIPSLVPRIYRGH